MSEATEQSRYLAIAAVGGALIEASDHKLSTDRATELATRVVDRVRAYGVEVFRELLESDDEEGKQPNG